MPQRWQMVGSSGDSHELRSSFCPSKEDLDKLLRYEAMINKQLNHAIAELEACKGGGTMNRFRRRSGRD
jgi:hypothetical protein